MYEDSSFEMFSAYKNTNYRLQELLYITGTPWNSGWWVSNLSVQGLFQTRPVGIRELRLLYIRRIDATIIGKN